MSARLPIDRDALIRLCRRWNITRFELFGSVLRDDFKADSDVDVMVTFAPGVHFTLASYQALQQELVGLLGRQVDFVTRRAVERDRNPYRRNAILTTAEDLYAA